jgi:hypothetical protein
MALASAIVLIGGSLTALDREVLSTDAWHSVDEAKTNPVVLAPDERRARDAETFRVTLPRGGAAVTPAVPTQDTRTPLRGLPGTGVRQRADERALREIEGTIVRSAAPAAPAAPSAGRATGTGVAADTDGDGLADLLERRIGTNAGDADTDGDARPDGWEQTHGRDPVIAIGAGAGLKGNGMLKVPLLQAPPAPLPVVPEAAGAEVPAIEAPATGEAPAVP